MYWAGAMASYSPADASAPNATPVVASMPVVLHASVSAGTGATQRLELIAFIFTLFAKKFTPTEPGEKL